MDEKRIVIEDCEYIETDAGIRIDKLPLRTAVQVQVQKEYKGVLNRKGRRHLVHQTIHDMKKKP